MQNSDNHAADLVLSIDHIVEKIFENLETSDVKNYRFVCHRWARFGAKELQTRVTINLKKDTLTEDWMELNVLLNQAKTPGQTEIKTLSKLTNLISNSTKFPCNSFRFYVGRLSDLRLQHFLNTHGSFIRKLEFCPLNVSVIGTNEVSSENIIVSGLRKLLLEQTVNLQDLELHIGVSSGPGQGLGQQVQEQANINEDKNTQLVTACLTHPNQNSLNVNLSNVNLKLKILKIWNHLPKEIFDQIIKIVPNLKEMELENKDLHYLIRPLNRIYLLKKLSIQPNKDTIGELEIIADHAEDIKLTEIAFHFGLILYTQEETWPRVVNVINRILQSSSSTLKKVTWRRGRFLPGVVFPVMDNVTEIQMIHYSSRIQNSEQLPQLDYYYCPQGLSMHEIFPNLKIVRVINKYRYQAPADELMGHGNSHNSTSLFSSVPVPSVKYVIIENLNVNQGSERFMDELVQRISQVFPCAKVLTY